MIDKILRRLLFLGALATAGCASTVKEEEFLAYKTKSENTAKSLREDIATTQKRTTEVNARYEILLKSIEDLNARMSVSSIDSYAVGLEEQATKQARQYAQLVRSIVALQKKGWELGDTTTKGINQLRADSTSTDNSLDAKILELKKLHEDAIKAYETFKKDDYADFKDRNLRETSAQRQKIETFETGLRNLSRVIALLEKRPDHPKALEQDGEGATEFACAELHRQMLGFKAASIEPTAGYVTREDISRILITPIDSELVERVLGNMAVGNLDLDSKIELYSKAIDVLSNDYSYRERLYGVANNRSAMLAVLDELIILKLKLLVGQEESTVMNYVNGYAKFPFISRQRNDNRVLLDLFSGLGRKGADLGEVLLTFNDGKLAIVQTGPDGSYVALLQSPQETFRQQVVLTNNSETDAHNQLLFERDKKTYINEKEELKRSYTDLELQQQTDILRKKYEHLFEPLNKQLNK